MRVEQAVELDEGSPKLEIPWPAAKPDSGYFDLRDDPRAIARIEPARQHPPLRVFLVALNGEDSVFATARCGLSRREQSSSHPGTQEFSSEIVLVFAEMPFNCEQVRFEELSRRLAELLEREGGAEYLSVRLCLRQCRFAVASHGGFCLSVLLSARGATAEQAEMRWGLALARVQQALLFLSRVLRQKGAANS